MGITCVCPTVHQNSFLVRHRARLPPGILEEGAAFWQRPAEKFLDAMAQGDLFVTPVALKIKDAIEQSLLAGVSAGATGLLDQEVRGAGERSSIRPAKPYGGKSCRSPHVGGGFAPVAVGLSGDEESEVAAKQGPDGGQGGG